MGCFVHVILLGMGCFVSLQKNMWGFLSTYNKMDVGGYVPGVFCPYTDQSTCSRRVRDTSPKTTLPKRHFAETTLCRMRHFVEILPKFGKNAEKDVIKTISYNVFFS